MGPSTDWLSGAVSALRPESGLGLALTLGLIGLLPGVLIALTSYARIVIVLSFIKQGLALGEVPPAMLINGLAIFLTYFTMATTFEVVGRDAVQPLMRQEIGVMDAVKRAASPLSDFMLRQVRHEELALFLSLAEMPQPETPADVPFHVLVPAFILSELKVAFTIGILILLPFVLVDLGVSLVTSVLGLAGTGNAPLSLILKLALFVSVDGWSLVVGSLVRSFQ